MNFNFNVILGKIVYDTHAKNKTSDKYFDKIMISFCLSSSAINFYRYSSYICIFKKRYRDISTVKKKGGGY
jgi:hypothetical protein